MDAMSTELLDSHFQGTPSLPLKSLSPYGAQTLSRAWQAASAVLVSPVHKPSGLSHLANVHWGGG